MLAHLVACTSRTIAIPALIESTVVVMISRDLMMSMIQGNILVNTLTWTLQKSWLMWRNDNESA